MRRFAVTLAVLAAASTSACGGSGGGEAGLAPPVLQPPAFEDGAPAPAVSLSVPPGAELALTAPLPIGGDGPLDIVRADVVLAGDGLGAGVAQLLPPVDAVGLVGAGVLVRDGLGDLAGTTLTQRRNGVGVVLRAARRGVYLIRGLELGYRRDGEDGEQIVGPAACVVVAARSAGACDGDPARLFENTQVAAVGVELLSEAGVALAPMPEAGLGRRVVVGARGTVQVGIALANLSDTPLELDGIAPIRLDAGARSLRGEVTGATSFTLAPFGSRLLRVQLRAAGCGEPPSAGAAVTQLAARVDGEDARIPLGVPVTLGPASC